MHRSNPPCSTDLVVSLVEPSRFVDFEVWRLLKLMNLYLIDLGLHLRLAEAA
jgi:hypothetical protein